MKKAIEIEELRISASGEYLEFIINCPYDYRFTTFNIQVIGKESIYSIADSVFKKDGEYILDTDNRFMGQIQVSALEVSEPEMYKIYLEAYHIENSEHTSLELAKEQELNPCESTIPPTISTTAYISDVSRVYECLSNDIRFVINECADNTKLNDLIRNYLILYAHQEAMHMGYLDEAIKWFKIIKKCYKSCNKTYSSTTLNNSCNCSK